MAEDITLADLTEGEKVILRRVWMGTMQRRFDAAMEEYQGKKAHDKNLTFQAFLQDEGDFLTWAYSQMRENPQSLPEEFRDDWDKMSVDQKQRAIQSLRRGGRKTRRRRARSRRTRH
jgi:hypothetical protein